MPSERVENDLISEGIAAQPIILDDSCPPITRDPPPPYPSVARRSRRAARRSQRSHHAQISSGDSHSEHDSLSPQALRTAQPFPYPPDDDDAEPSETTPFLAPAPPTSRSCRPRAFSHASTIVSTASGAPSLAQTLLSIFNPDDDEDTVADGFEDQGRSLLMQEDEPCAMDYNPRPHSMPSARAWAHYFRPMGRSAYYKSLVHLLLVNFPYALVAWVYLFVCTLTGTTLLVALPLGAGICFLNLLGARAFARGELALQTHFHAPLAYAAPYPPRPIFTRFREPTIEEVEEGTSPGVLIPERSFFKNSYAMFKDPTSYQALFYFLVIKPGITLGLGIGLLILAPVSFILILPAPLVLRAARKLGIWQANIAVEGLYFSLR